MRWLLLLHAALLLMLLISAAFRGLTCGGQVAGVQRFIHHLLAGHAAAAAAAAAEVLGYQPDSVPALYSDVGAAAPSWQTAICTCLCMSNVAGE
jgi:hypothetical protein